MIRVVIPASATPQELELTHRQWAALWHAYLLPPRVHAKLAAVADVPRKAIWLTGAEVDEARRRMGVEMRLVTCPRERRSFLGVVAKLEALQARAAAFDRAAAAASRGDRARGIEAAEGRRVQRPSALGAVPS